MDHGHDEQHGVENTELQALQQQLGRLVGAWRDVDGDAILQAQYVRLYHATMRSMIDQGWDPTRTPLDDSATLPDLEMPRAYLRQLQGEPYTWDPVPASPEDREMMGVEHDVDEDGDALDPELASLERALERLGEEWFATVALPARCRMVVATYHAVMDRMLELGWRGLLDPDAELPDALMPAAYVRWRGKNHDSWYEQHQKIRSADFQDEWLLIDTAVSGIHHLPLTRVPRLYAADAEQRQKWQLTEDQQAVEWPELSVTVSWRIFWS